MNGESFKSFLEKDLNIIGIDIFIKTSKNSKEEEKLYSLKSIKSKDLLKKEIKTKQKILNIFESMKDKNIRCYDSHKSRDEIFYLNLNDLSDMKDLNNIIVQLSEVQHKYPQCKEYKDNIKMLIVKVFTEAKHNILFFIKYDYNNFIEKNFFGEFVGDEFDITEKKIMVLNFSPNCILFDEELLIMNNYVNLLFDFSAFYKKFIESNATKIQEVFHLTDKTFKTKNHKFYITRGIMTGGLDKYNSFNKEEKRIKIEKFKKVFKDKYNETIEVKYEDEKINIEEYSSIKKEEIIKFVTNKAALTSLTEELTTALD